MSEQQVKRLHARLQGRVQGVGFRYFVQRQASQIGVRGWTRNRWDGSVEVVAEGSPNQLESLLRALRRGPTGASVSNVEPQWQDATGEFSGFSIRGTV